MKNCVHCGIEFVPSKHNPRQINCSKSCSIRYQRKRAVESGRKKVYSKRWAEKHQDLKKQLDVDYVNRTYFGGLREQALERDGHKCTRCGSTKKLIVHHIDENPKADEVIKNLTTLCRSCHAKEHHSGEDNSRYKYVTKEQIIKALEQFPRDLESAAKSLGITRSVLRDKRIMFGMPMKRKAKKEPLL